MQIYLYYAASAAPLQGPASAALSFQVCKLSSYYCFSFIILWMIRAENDHSSCTSVLGDMCGSLLALASVEPGSHAHCCTASKEVARQVLNQNKSYNNKRKTVTLGRQ